MSKTLNIKITGLGGVIDEFLLSDKQVAVLKKAALDAVTRAVTEQWKKEARKGLHSSREQYIRSIGVMNTGRYTNAIILNGAFPNAMESGAPAFDMKQGFSKSPKAKRTENGGWYLVIPFRYAVPGSLGESSAFSGVLPQSIYALVKDFKPSTTDTGGKTSRGDSLKATDIPADLGAKKRRGSFTNIETKKTFDEYINKTSLYEGLQKSSKFYEETQQGSYHTFRVVSSKSEPGSWIHPGFTALNYAQAALNNARIDTVVNNTIDLFLSKL